MLYTISKMAKILKIPESTARYYRDRYPDFMISVGSGRKKRYKKETLKSLRLIAELSNRSLSAEDINNHLSKEFSRNIEIEEQNRSTTAVEQQHHYLEIISNSLRSIADQKKEIADLREEVNELKKYIEQKRLSWWKKLFLTIPSKLLNKDHHINIK